MDAQHDYSDVRSFGDLTPGQELFLEYRPLKPGLEQSLLKVLARFEFVADDTRLDRGPLMVVWVAGLAATTIKTTQACFGASHGLTVFSLTRRAKVICGDGMFDGDLTVWLIEELWDASEIDADAERRASEGVRIARECVASLGCEKLDFDALWEGRHEII